MARLSDFQKPQGPEPYIGTAFSDRNAKRVHSQPHWSKTRVTATEGANAPYMALLMDAEAEINEDPEDEARVHSDSDEPEEEDPNAEPLEEEAKDALAAFDNFLAVLTSSSSTLKNSVKQRTSAMDGIQLRFGKPDDNARDAIGKFGIGFDVNTSERMPWFELLCAWIHKHPKETKVKDLSQPKLQCLLRQMYEAA
jgi:hypothetical protein